MDRHGLPLATPSKDGSQKRMTCGFVMTHNFRFAMTDIYTVVIIIVIAVEVK